MSYDFNSNIHGITASGRRICATHPAMGEFSIEDIAEALSKLCRFGGHCYGAFYSVAQHSALMAMQFSDRELAREALMHDATEAYCQDLIRAVKNRCPDYRVVEAEFWHALATRFKLSSKVHLSKDVRVMDNRMLVSEKLKLFPNAGRWELEDLFEPADVIIEPLEWREAKELFLDCARKLFPEEFR